MLPTLPQPPPEEGTRPVNDAVTLLRIRRLAEIAIHRIELAPDLPTAIEALEAIERMAKKALS